MNTEMNSEVAQGNKTKKKKNEGFTLIEMLIVIALLGMVAAFVGSNIFSKFDKAKVDSTKIQMKQLITALKDYRRICNSYPDTDQGLDALVQKPEVGNECKNWEQSMEKLPKDSWNKEFIYESDGRKFTLISLGQDGAEGGEETAKDISSDDPDF